MATQKKAPAKKTKTKSIVSKKKLTKKPTTRKRILKELSGLEIALKISAQNPKLWSTDFPGIRVNHFVAKKTASKWVKSFNKRKAAVSKSAFMQPENIDKQIFLDLLNRPEVKSLRIYFGQNEFGKVRLLFVGTDENHNDVYVKNPGQNEGMEQAKSIIDIGGDDGVIDMAQGCPSYNSGKTVMLP